MRNAYCTNGVWKVFENNLPSSADHNTFSVYWFCKLYSEICGIGLCILHILGFSVPSIILADLLGNTYLLAWVQKVMVCDSWLVDFDPFCLFHVGGSLLCDRPVLGNYWLAKFALQIFMIFLIHVTCKNKATSASFRRQKIHSPSWFPSLLLSSLESFSAKLDVHVTLWFALTPPSLKWLTEQKSPKSLWILQNMRRDTTNFALKHQEK